MPGTKAGHDDGEREGLGQWPTWLTNLKKNRFFTID
jgi:hypothetical protein